MTSEHQLGTVYGFFNNEVDVRVCRVDADRAKPYVAYLGSYPLRDCKARVRRFASKEGALRALRAKSPAFRRACRAGSVRL